MSVNKSNNSAGVRVISVAGRFDFKCHQEFRSAYGDLSAGSPVIVDFAETTYVDSAALGMLMLLREHVGGASCVRIARPHGQPNQVLRIANFHRLFQYDGDAP